MKKILIIDDDVAILEVIKIILLEEGYEVLTETDGAEIFSIIKTNSPSIILLDYWLPGIDGGKIVKSLKGQEQTKNIPIIMISANHNLGRKATSMGADDFLEKPFEIADLVKLIEKNLKKAPLAA